MEIIVKEIDSLGRIYIPAEWRRSWRKVLLIRMPDDTILIRPIRKKMKLTDLIDSIMIDVKSEEFVDPHKLKGRLYEEEIY